MPFLVSVKLCQYSTDQSQVIEDKDAARALNCLHTRLITYMD